MKNFSRKILSGFMVLSLAVTAFAIEPVTLKDNKTGMTVNLYPIPDESELLFYGNMAIGYNVNVPYKVFTKVINLPKSGEGMTLESKDGKARFSVTGGRKISKNMVKESYNKACKAIGGEQKASYSDIGDVYWQLCWWKGKTFHQRRFLINEDMGVWADCEIYYVTSNDEGTYDPLDDIMHNAVGSLVFGEG